MKNSGNGRSIANNLPVVITEGAKKTASLLCAGHVAIGLSGVYNFSKKVEGKQAWETPLNERLQAFFKALCVRHDSPQITIAYDADPRLETIKNVTNAATRLAKKLQWHCNADVKIAKWHPELGKGIDDVLVANGPCTVGAILKDAWFYQTFCFLENCQLTYPVHHKINQRYLGKIPNFIQRIIGIKSAKNTGKTYSLATLCYEYIRADRKVIVLSHRVQLASELANRLGIEFINEIKKEKQWQMASKYGFALCIDSFHPNSKARVDLTDNFDFDDAVVIVDEAEQVLNHLVGSDTLKNNRAEIVTQLKMLCERAHKIYLSDADLSDYSINFFREVADLGRSDVAIIHNQYEFTDLSWRVHLYSEKNPDRLLLEIEKQLQQGKRVLLHVGGQKSKSLYSAGNCLKGLQLARMVRDDSDRKASKYFNRLHPYSSKALLLDSHTVADPEHEAYGMVSKLNDLATTSPPAEQLSLLENETPAPSAPTKDFTGYQLVVASPVIETGVSIEADLFDAVFCISYGVQSVQSVAQALARYRHPVDRHVWVQNRPANFQKFGGLFPTGN